jgi:hypothetical protein
MGMRRGLALAAFVALAGCSDRPAPNNAVCTAFPAPANTGATVTTIAPEGAAPGAAGAPTQSANAATALEDCLHRWGYRLAGSPDPATVTAQATVAACGQSLSAWNVQGAAEAQQGAQALDVFTGQATSSPAQHAQFAHSRALFYVVQARAGHCLAPAANQGR